MPPAKENDVACFPSPLAPPSSSCPPTQKPLSSMYRLPLTIVPTNYNIQVSRQNSSSPYKNRCFRFPSTFPSVCIEVMSRLTSRSCPPLSTSVSM